MPAQQRTKYGRRHTTASAALRTAWYHDPATTCCFCGLTHAEGVARYGEARAAWEADHPDGRTDIALRPAHATCNRADGARRGNRQREPHTEWW